MRISTVSASKLSLSDNSSITDCIWREDNVLPVKRRDARLDVARHAADLFIRNGLAATSGAHIAAASGLSERTIWRYFGSKESCVEPLFLATTLRFHAKLRRWPRHVSIEDHLDECCKLEDASPQDIADGVLAVQLLALMAKEPALRGVWLVAAYAMEQDLVSIIADRLDRSVRDFDVRLCAATIAAAMRMIDETISIAAIEHKQQFTTQEIVQHLAKAIRQASTLPICDPITPNVFGRADRPLPAQGPTP
ncbi:TetR/AcrR family transcriptional regulator [Neorhizobium sp. NPDC001467]|uniref:TetR/AcrR family transcriptional regulator n=1 Tax=Neorhizobium sp. NPDC001467 TaxID=3390595 RepID=UPI003CFD6CCE